MIDFIEYQFVELFIFAKSFSEVNVLIFNGYRVIWKVTENEIFGGVVCILLFMIIGNFYYFGELPKMRFSVNMYMDIYEESMYINAS